MCYYYVTGSDYNTTGTRHESGGKSNLRFARIRNTPNLPFMVTIQDDTTPEPVEVIEVQVRCEAEENCYSPRSFYTIAVVDDEGENQTMLCVEGIV